jgi:hypothetical protein
MPEIVGGLARLNDRPPTRHARRARPATPPLEVPSG